MAPSAAGIALRAGALAFAFAFGYLIRLAVRNVCWPKIAVVTPPIAVFVVVAFHVTVRVLILFTAVDAGDLLVHVRRVSIEAFTSGPIFAFTVQLLVSLVR